MSGPPPCGRCRCARARARASVATASTASTTSTTKSHQGTRDQGLGTSTRDKGTGLRCGQISWSCKKQIWFYASRLRLRHISDTPWKLLGCSSVKPLRKHGPNKLGKPGTRVSNVRIRANSIYPGIRAKVPHPGIRTKMLHRGRGARMHLGYPGKKFHPGIRASRTDLGIRARN